MAIPSQYIEIKKFHPEYVPQHFEKMIAEILAAPETDLGRVLIEQIKPGISIQLDLRYFIPIFELLEGVLSKGVEDLPHSQSYHLENSLLLNTLKYLSHTLKNATQKRYFLSIELIGGLMMSHNLSVVELSSEILFYFSMPSFSLASFTDDQAKDPSATQLSTSTTETVGIIFESLGYFSPAYGLMDYLRGHGPLLCPTDDVVINYRVQPKSEPESPSEKVFLKDIKITIDLNDTFNSVDDQMSTILSNIPDNSMSPIQLVGLRYAVTASHSLRSSLQCRVPLLVLRLRLLYILIHCQSSYPGDSASHLKILDSYLTSSESSSKILKDLIVLADISSSIWVELDLALFPYPLASLALDCLMGIFESNQTQVSRRPGKSQIHTLLLQEVGISPANDRNTNENSSDLHWLSILLSACSLMSQVSIIDIPSSLQQDTECKDNDNVSSITLPSRQEVMGLMSCYPNSEGRIPKAYIAEYAHMAIELFSGCLTIREYRIQSEGAGLGALISLVSNHVGTLERLLTTLDASKVSNEWPELVYDLFPILKAMQCLEISVSSHSSRASILRENDWLTVLSQLLEIFSKSKSPLLWKPNSVLNDILLSAFNLLGILISGGRRRMVLATESGTQLLYHPHVSVLFHLALTVHSQTSGEFVMSFSLPLLQTFCELFSSAIEVEPTYLSHFLRTGLAEQLLDVMTLPTTLPNQSLSSPLCPHPVSYSPIVQKPEGILIDFLRLLQSMCITAEGRSLVAMKQAFQKVVEATVHPVNLFPMSEGISTETLGFIGSELNQLLRDHNPTFRSAILEVLRNCFLGSCERARISDDQSAVQQILNLSTILETILSPGRDGVSAEVAKEFFKGDVVSIILETYRATLPSTRQLFSEITTHYQSTSRKYFGDYYLSQSFTTLLKIGVSLSPQDSLPKLFSALDACLVEIGIGRDSLMSRLHSEPGAKRDSQFMEFKDEHKKNRRIDSPPNVMFLGVLDQFPDECIFSELFRSLLSDNASHEYLECLGNMVKSLVALDWMASITAVCLHPNRQTRTQAIDARLMMSGKDVLRRLFAFYRSSLLEVCRVFSQKWGSKPLREFSRYASFQESDFSVLPPFSDSDSESSKSEFPARYLLKICISSGAIARERSEIDGSRVLLTLNREAELIAYERVRIQGGIIRYRTTHGWISEFQRDTKRHPIVTVLDLLGPEEISPTQRKREFMAAAHSEPMPNRARQSLESCTLRDGVCHLLSRIHASLKIAASSLSQTVVADLDSRHSERLFASSSIKFTEFGHMIALSMAKITCKFFENPLPNEINIWPKDSLSRTPSEEKLLVDEDESKKPNWKKIHEGQSSTTESQKSVELSFPAVALYFGAVINFILATLSDERRKNPNTYLLKRYVKHGIIHSVLNTFHFLVNQCTHEFSDTETNASTSLRCIYHSLPPLLSLLNRLVQYDALNRAPMTAVMRTRGSDTNDSDVTQIIQKLLLKVGKGLFPLFKANLFRILPDFIQSTWMKVIEELLESLKILSDSTRRGHDSGLNETISGRLARMRSALHSASGERLVDREEETSRRHFVDLFSSEPSEDSQLMEAATDLGFTPLQVIDAIHTLDTEDMHVVLEHLLHSNLHEPRATTEVNPFNQFVQEQSGDFATASGDSAQSTLSHSQPDTISEQLSVTQASVVSALSGANTLPTMTSEGGSTHLDFVSDHQLASSSDSDSSTSEEHHPPPVDRHDSSDSDSESHEPVMAMESRSQTFGGDDDDEEMLRMALAMSMNSGQEALSSGNQECNNSEFMPHRLISPSRDVLSPPQSLQLPPNTPSNRRSSSKTSKEDSLTNQLVGEAKQLLKDYDQLVLPWVNEMWKNLHWASLWSDESATQLSSRLYHFTIRLAPVFPQISLRALLETLLRDITQAATEESPNNHDLLGLLSFLHIILCSIEPRSRVTSTFSIEKGHQLIQSLSSLLQKVSCPQHWTWIAFLLSNDILSTSPLQSSNVIEDANMESKDDIGNSSENTFASFSGLIYGSVDHFIKNLNGLAQEELLQSLLLLLCTLLTSEEISTQFVDSGNLERVLSFQVLHRKTSVATIQPLVSLVIRRCLETSSVLSFSMRHEMKTIFKSLEQSQIRRRTSPAAADVKILLDEFLSKTSHLMIRNSALYSTLLPSVLSTYRNSEKDASLTFVRLSDSVDEQWPTSLGIPTMATLSTILETILTSVHSSVGNQFISPAMCLNALTDCVLVFKSLALPLVRKGKDGELFVGHLIEKLFKEEVISPNSLHNIQAATRLFSVLCSYRGPSRRTILDLILKSLKESKTLVEESRFLFLKRLGLLIPIVCASCKFTRESFSPEGPLKAIHMSVDTLSYLLNADICLLLTESMMSCDPQSKGAADLLGTLLEALEIFTRPNLLSLVYPEKPDQNVGLAHGDPVVDSVEVEEPRLTSQESTHGVSMHEVPNHEEEEDEEEDDEGEDEDEDEEAEEEIDEAEDEEEDDNDDHANEEYGEDANDNIQISSGFPRPSTRSRDRFAEMLEMFQGQSPDLAFLDGNQNFRTPEDVRSLPFDLLGSESLNDDHFARNAFYHFIRSVAPDSLSRDPRVSHEQGNQLNSREELLPGGVERALRTNWAIGTPSERASLRDTLRMRDPLNLLGTDEPMRTPDRRERRVDHSALGREMERFFQVGDASTLGSEATFGWLLGRSTEGSGEIIERLRQTLRTQAAVELPQEIVEPSPENVQQETREPPQEIVELEQAVPQELASPGNQNPEAASNLEDNSEGALPLVSEPTHSLIEFGLPTEPPLPLPNQDDDLVADLNASEEAVDTHHTNSIILDLSGIEMNQPPPGETVQLAEDTGGDDSDQHAEAVEQVPAESGLICPPGYDVEVFNSLPEFMQREIIESHQETSGDQMNALLEAAGYDVETLNALPENIRQEIIDQVRRDNPQSEALVEPQAQEIDNNTFLSSLTDDLRNEVLLTADAEFLASLNPEYQAQANLIRERHARRWTQMEASQAIARDAGNRRAVERTRDAPVPPAAPEPPVHPGFMRLKKNDVSNLKLPDMFLRFFFGLLFLDVLPIPLRTLQRIAQNISRDKPTRRFLLQIIMALLGDAPRESETFLRLRNGSQAFPPDKVILTSHPGVSLVVENAEDSAVLDIRPPLPSLVGRRLLSLLLNLNGHVESISYEYLQPRSLVEMKSLTQDLEDDEVNTCHNYLEILIRLLRFPQLTDNDNDMLQLTSLINQLCEPLEILKELSPQAEQETPTDEIFENDFRWVRVPAVPLSKSSLKALCDALMSEFCTKEVFDHIISAISRLACVKENCSVLMEVLVEVILDLSLLSSSRIQTVVSHLAEMSKLSLSAQRVLSIPLGEIGSQDHLRLFRALQMLQTLCTKEGKSVTEVLPPDEFHSIWQSTDHMLRLLETHFIPADSLEKFDQKKQLNSTLSSILSKILPLIEGFFLVHTVDFLNEASRKIEANDSTQKSKGQETPQQASSPGVESLPGAKYRTSEAFKKANISLLGEGDRELQHGSSLSRLKSFQQTRSLRSNPSFDSASSFMCNPSSGPHRLLSFVHSHKNILNLLIRWYPALLDTSLQSFIRIVQLRSYLSFDSKRLHFYSQLKQRKHSAQTHHRSIHLQVHRETIFEESFNQLRFRSADEMRGRLVVSFADEEGIDAGGLTREWFGILTREIFNPNYCLFTAAADGVTFQPNPYSSINTNHLDYFKFVGKVFGKAVVDGFLLDGHFTRSFYKHVLGIPVEYNDIEGLEPEYFKSLKQILEFPLEDLGLELTFSAESQTFGRHQVVDLVPNGRNFAVTDQNKTDYIRLISHHSMTSAIHSQITSFLDGFYELVPVELISVFTPTELELLISGLPDIDIDDLRIHTDYHQYRVADETIQWFWNVLRGFTREEKALFLQFVTGTSKVPLDGFDHLQGMRGPQRFSIHRAYTDLGNLPTAHTCFNQLDLPEYKSEQDLREKLLMAIKEGSEGFGFA